MHLTGANLPKLPSPLATAAAQAVHPRRRPIRSHAALPQAVHPHPPHSNTFEPVQDGSNLVTRHFSCYSEVRNQVLRYLPKKKVPPCGIMGPPQVLKRID